MDFKLNFFQIFQFDTDFAIDQAALTSRFHDLQQTVHPDKFAAASDQEKRLSVQWATRVNEAYTTLKHALSRAIYLLELQDVSIEHNPNLDPMFLMSQVELREDLEDIEAMGEAGLDKLDKFKRKVKDNIVLLESQFSTQFAAQDTEAATITVYKLQFINKLLFAVDQLEVKLLDY